MAQMLFFIILFVNICFVTYMNCNTKAILMSTTTFVFTEQLRTEGYLDSGFFKPWLNKEA